MAALFQFPYVLGIPVLPVRRIIAIDPGSHSLKFMLTESSRRHFRVLKKQIVDLPGEGLVSPEEIGVFVQNTLREMGDYPVVLALPQHIPMSQLIDLGPGNADGVKQLIERETLKNRDMYDSPIVYDCQKLHPFGKHQNSFWVTLCKEKDVFAQITRLSLNPEDVCEIVSSANALAEAYGRVAPGAKPCVLVDFGASSTLVVVVVEGQAVHSGNFAIGGNLITEAIAAQMKCSMEAAENVKRTKNVFSGEEALSSVLPSVQSWRTEVERIVRDWQRDNREVKSDFPIVLCGGNAQQPGLIDFLNKDAKHRFTPWPSQTTMDLSPQFAVTAGATWQSFSERANRSLVPTELRSHWSKQKIHQRILSFSFLLLALAAILLIAGTAQKISHTGKKQDLLELAESALEKTKMTGNLDREAAVTYERLRPILKREQQTFDTLTALSLIGQTKADRNLWYVLVADNLSYFTGQTSVSTNPLVSGMGITNAPKRGFVAELCINEDGEARRRILGQVVTDLKQNPLFANVDTLPADRRKGLANPKVLVPERHFALSMELVGDDFQQPITPPAESPAKPQSTGTPPPPPDNRNSVTNRTIEE